MSEATKYWKVMRAVLALGLTIVACDGIEEDGALEADELRGDFTTEPPPGDWKPGLKPLGEQCWVFEVAGLATASFINGGGGVTFVKPLSNLSTIDGEFTVSGDLIMTVPGEGAFNLANTKSGGAAVTLLAANGAGVTIYESTKGTVTVVGDPGDDDATLWFDGLRLEVASSGDSAKKRVDRCLGFLSFSVGGVVQVPKQWTCADGAYTDATCDCGCGVLDPLCDTASASACDMCTGVGTCVPKGETCAWITPDDNSSCTEPEPEPEPDTSPLPGQTTIWADVEALFDGECSDDYEDCANESGCNTAGYCHVGGASPLPDVLSYTVSASLVTPGDLDQSYLLDRVESGSMPPGVAFPNLDVLRDWIADGALLTE